MAHPPLYKYLGVEGAKKTLGTNPFRHAEPSGFNDEDLTIASIFSENDAAVAVIAANFSGVIVANLDRPPKCTRGRFRLSLPPST